MKACDRCLDPDAFVIEVQFKKFDGGNRLGRKMLGVRMEICDACITDLLKQFGKFKVGFMEEADTTERKEIEQ